MGDASLRAAPLMPRRLYESPLWFRALSVGSAPVLIWILARSALVETSPLGLLPDTYFYFLRMTWETPWARTATLVEHTLMMSLGALLVAVIDFLFGWTALRLLLRGRRLSLPAPLEAAAALALGLGLSGTILFGLGIAGQLHRSSVLVLTALQAAAGIWVLSRKRERRRAFLWLAALRPARENRLLVVAILAILSPVAVLHLFDLLHPVIAFDSANYHMAAAKIYRETATLSFLDGVRFNAQPHLSVLLYLRHWLLWDEDFAAKLVNLEFELILLLTLVYAAREVRWRDGWILGVLFLAAMPALAGIASVEYAELSVAAFAAAGCAVLFHQVRRAGPPGESRLWVVAGLLFGFAAAAKHTGAALFACAIVGYMAARVLSRSLKAECFRSVGVLGLAGFLPVSIWWARSWIHTGTPFYPFWQTLHYPEGPAPPYDLGAVYRVDHSLGGIAQTFFGLVRGSQDVFHDPAAFGIALPLLVLVAAVAALTRFRARAPRRATSGVGVLALAAAAYLLFWSVTAPLYRFATPLLFIAAIGFLSCLRTIGYRRQLAIVPTMLLIGGILHSVPATSFTNSMRLPPPVNRAEREAVLAAALPFYPAVTALNRVADRQDQVYILHVERARYHLDSTAYGDWFERYSYPWLWKDASSLAEALDKLRRAGFRYLLANHRQVAPNARELSGARIETLTPHSAAASGAEVIHADQTYLALKLF